VPPRSVFSERTASRTSRCIPEDRAFQEAFAKRCPAAWSHVFAGMSRVFRKHIRQVLPRNLDHDEVLSETWYRAYKYAHKYDSARPLVPWLLTVCHRACLRQYERHCRREDRVEQGTVPNPASWDPHPSDEPPVLVNLISQLPERDLEILALRVLHDFSTAVVAEVLGVSQAVVRQRFARALDRLQNVTWPRGQAPNGTSGRTHGEMRS